MLNTFYIDALDLPVPSSPVSSSSTSAVPESGPASSKSPARNTNIGLIRGHPTMNGTFSLRYECLIVNVNLLARPCDKHGNFLNDNEQPLAPEPKDSTDWTPFTSRLQFETAEFLFTRAQMSAGKIDELCNLWTAGAAKSGGEPPFFNHTHLYDTIDAIPIGGVPWQSFSVSYAGERPETNVPPWMEELYEVHFRDPRHLFLNMLGNPTFADNFDYAPMRIFDVNGSRRYEHFMSGDWAWSQAVRVPCSNGYILLTIIYRISSQTRFPKPMAQCLFHL
jgi:Plavaka transposase